MSAALQPLEIVGGGLAGLSLGLALRRADVPVTVFEAGAYPRHRVCGEFITGLDARTIATLGLAPFLADARPHSHVAWFRGGCRFRTQVLPETAWAISRYDLDARLADAFVRAGGDLRLHTRADLSPHPGRVIAAGRRRAAPGWIGLKQHVRGLELCCGLEMHLGGGAYVGLCALPDGAVNLCGLFRRPPAAAPSGARDALNACLRASDFARLADRIARSERDPASAAAVAGFDFRGPKPSAELRLGDARAMLPPFLGNGMAAAFQMAAEALAPLLAWSGGTLDWPVARAQVESRLDRRFRRRERWGRAIHCFLLAPRRQRWFAALARSRCLPVHRLYRILH